jgi:hypothetical protein
MPTKRTCCGCGVSRLRTESARVGGVNSQCHTYTGGVPANSKRILRAPRIVLVLWGAYYNDNADVVSTAKQLMTDLATGRFMNGLVQYGVGSGSLEGTIVIKTDSTNPAPQTFNDVQMVAQLKAWISSSPATISPAPAVNESNLLYFIFPPTTTQLTLSDGTTGFCGYHQHAKYNSQSNNDDLFWAIVGTNQSPQTSAQAFVNSIAYCVSHEFAEAATDRDGGGFIASNNCEIGDICEVDGSGQIVTFSYRGWDVERYWPDWDKSCIHGDQPVSLRKFLAAINFNTQAQGLRGLNTSVISLSYMASQLPV